MTQNIEKDFSGGITDYYLDPGPNQHAKLDNWLLEKNNTATVRPGSRVYDSAFARAESGRVGKVFEFAGSIFKVISTKLWRYTVSGWSHLKGPVAAGDVAFPSADATTGFSYVKQNNHLILTSNKSVGLPRKAYLDNTDVWRVFTAGLPKLSFVASYPSFVPSVAEGFGYIYYFVASRKYTVSGGVAFQDLGAVTLFQATGMPNMSLGGGRSITISPSAGLAWPHPADTSTDFYDQTNNKISIYRTKTNGTVGYFVADVSAGTVSTYVDTKTDAQLGASIYINGDVLDWDQPPIAKFVAQCQDIVWYCNVIEVEAGVAVVRPYRVRQSIKFGLDKCPVTFVTDVDGDITAASSVGDYPLIFTDSKFWRLEGFVDTQGNGFTRKILVSDTVGCICNDSIIQSQRGVAFAGIDGFYFTDGFNVTRISDLLSVTYPSLVGNVVNSAQVVSVSSSLRRSRINGAYDRGSDRYYWSVQNNIDRLDNDVYFIWDASFGVKSDGVFTTMSSGVDMSPTASVFVNGNLLRGDSRGYLLIHKQEYFDDVRIESRPSPVNWINKAILYDYQSSGRSMGDSTITKWAGVLQTVFLNLSDVSVSPQTTDDDQKDWVELKEMRFRGNYSWGDPTISWGDPEMVWNYRSFIFFERRFPAGTLRFTYKQIRFVPSYTVILASNGVELATLDDSLLKVTISGVAREFQADYVGYYLHFSYNNYATAYEIVTFLSSTEVIVESSAGGFLNGSYDWEIRGYRKGERLSLLSHITMFEAFGDSRVGWRVTDGAGNG